MYVEESENMEGNIFTPSNRLVCHTPASFITHGLESGIPTTIDTHNTFDLEGANAVPLPVEHFPPFLPQDSGAHPPMPLDRASHSNHT